MKLAISSLAVTAAVLVPTVVQAKQVTFETTIKDTGGAGTYVALYVTDAAGKYAGTLWVAGTKARYYRELSDWARLSGGRPAGIDGITGASIGSGQTLKVSVDLADALLNAGYQVHVDTTQENGFSNPSEVVVPLDKASVGKRAGGRGYVQSFTVSF